MKFEALQQPAKVKQQVLSQVTNSFDQQQLIDSKFGAQPKMGGRAAQQQQEVSKPGNNFEAGLQPQMVRRTSTTYKKKVETVD